nr:hypothetical protein [Aliamphritea spongicola]
MLACQLQLPGPFSDFAFQLIGGLLGSESLPFFCGEFSLRRIFTLSTRANASRMVSRIMPKRVAPMAKLLVGIMP